MKKIGLCSAVAEYTRQIAHEHFEKTGQTYVVFMEVIQDYIRAHNPSPKDKVKNIIIPSLGLLKENNAEVVIFDMDTLMHDKAVDEIKKNFDLYRMEVGRSVAEQKGTFIEKSLYYEYCKQLEQISDKWKEN